MLVFEDSTTKDHGRSSKDLLVIVIVRTNLMAGRDNKVVRFVIDKMGRKQEELLYHGLYYGMFRFRES